MGSRKRKNSNVYISVWYRCNSIRNSIFIYKNEHKYKYRNNRKHYKQLWNAFTYSSNCVNVLCFL